jgi:hypothetical protein
VAVYDKFREQHQLGAVRSRAFAPAGDRVEGLFYLAMFAVHADGGDSDGLHVYVSFGRILPSSLHLQCVTRIRARIIREQSGVNKGMPNGDFVDNGSVWG